MGRWWATIPALVLLAACTQFSNPTLVSPSDATELSAIAKLELAALAEVKAVSTNLAVKHLGH